MSYGIKIIPDTLRSIAFGDIGADYVALGSVFVHPMRIINIQNLTNAVLTFSFDGVNDHQVVPNESGIIFDFCTNRVGTLGAVIGIGTQIWVKQTSEAPASGDVYLSCYYGFGE